MSSGTGSFHVPTVYSISYIIILFNSGDSYITMNKDKYTRHLIVFLSILLVVGFFSTSFISYLVSRDSLKRQIVVNELPLTSDNVYSEIQRDLLPSIFISSLMAHDTFLRSWVIGGEKDPSSITRYLKEISEKYNTMTSFFVSEKTRTYYQTKGILKKVSPDSPRDAWFFRVRKMDPIYEINVDPDMANHDTMTIFINHKVFDFDGNFIGVTGVGLKISAVKALIEEYNKKYKRTIYFVNPEGKVVLYSSSFNQDWTTIDDVPGLRDAIKDLTIGTSRRIEYKRNGKNIFLNSRYIPELDWYLMVEQSADMVTAGIFKTLILNLIVCILVSVVVIVLVAVTVNSYKNKLQSALAAEIDLLSENESQRLEIEKQHKELLSKNERLTQLNKSKDKLFSIIAHDLRSPIGNIDSLLGMIREDLDGHLPEEQVETFTSLQNLTKSTHSLLENLLDWAKCQFSEVVCNPERFSPSLATTEAIAPYKAQAKQKGIGIKVESNHSVWAYGDLNIFKTIIRNLVSNAIKFTPQDGSITINILERDGKAAIAVKDSGVGIEFDRMADLFEFSEYKSTDGTLGESGTGLGLALSRDLAVINNGDIEVESTLGKGSTFTITLPKG